MKHLLQFRKIDETALPFESMEYSEQFIEELISAPPDSESRLMIMS